MRLLELEVTVSAFYNDARSEVRDDQGQKHIRDAVKDNQGQVLSAIPIELVINNRPGSFEVAATGGMTQEGKNVINPSQFAVVRFRSIREEQIRDWYLVMIGAFVALGAACLVELARLLAEGSGRDGG